MKQGLYSCRLLLVLALLQSGFFAANPALFAQPVRTLAWQERMQPDSPEQRQIVMEWPASIREKDRDWVALSLLVDAAGQVRTNGSVEDRLPGNTPDLYETHNVVAVARLEMAGLAAWREPLRETMRPGRPVRFRWSIQAEDAGVYRGVLWLSLELVPKAGGPVETMTLLSRPLTIEAVSFLGMPGWVGRVSGGAGMLLSTLFGFPLVWPWFAGAWDRWRNAAARKKSSSG